MQLSYRVRPQWQVGHYRIDLVVEGNGKRLAIECDGDRWHPPEKLAEDLERQAILERLGWTFVRVRGTEFFKHPDQALEPVFEMLQRCEIPPEGQVTMEPSRQSNELLDRLWRRAEALRTEWLRNDPNDGGDGEEAPEVAVPVSTEPAGELTSEEERVLEVLRTAGRPLAKSQILARTRIPEATWWSTIASLRRRGLVGREGTRRGATYRLAID